MQSRPYNLSKLLYYIVKSTPVEKRVIYANTTNTNDEMWKDDDGLKQYSQETRKTIFESVMEGACRGGEIGAEIGEKVFGVGSVGSKVVKGLGSVAGGTWGAIKYLFGR